MLLPFVLMIVLLLSVAFLGWRLVPEKSTASLPELPESLVKWLMLLVFVWSVLLTVAVAAILRGMVEWSFGQTPTSQLVFRAEPSIAGCTAPAFFPSVCCGTVLACRTMRWCVGPYRFPGMKPAGTIGLAYLCFAVGSSTVGAMFLGLVVSYADFEDDQIVQVRAGWHTRYHYADVVQIIAATHRPGPFGTAPQPDPQWEFRFANGDKITTVRFDHANAEDGLYEKAAHWVSRKSGVPITHGLTLESVPWSR